MDPVVRLPRLFRRGSLVEMTVRADEVQVGDRVIPKGNGGLDGKRRPVAEITKFVTELGEPSDVYLMVLSGGGSFTSIYLPDEPVSVVRRVR